MLKLYNTLTRQKEKFNPLNKKEVGLYTCGPTVYDYAHIGNLRTYIFEDILKRVLKYNGYKVKHVMNITDVGHLTDDADQGEDKLEKGSRREGKTVWEIAEFYTKTFKEDMKKLNLIEPDIWCKATDYIEEQINFVKKLEEKGFTYKLDDGIYFDTSKYPDYAKLGKLNIEGQEEGARVEKVAGKKNPTDFALWKFSPKKEKRQMEWESPWGIGFPGWHLECSAMSIKHLGEEFDIHCGGTDHIPVHHTNERAQNWGLTGKESVKFWLHGAFLNINEGKMAKSEGNFITLQTLEKKKINPLAYRFLALQTHYRSQLSFSWESLQAAQNGLENLYNVIRNWSENPKIGCVEYEKKFLTALNDDLDIPKAMVIMWKLIKDGELPISAKKQSILKFDQVLGLGLDKLKPIEIPEKVKKLAQEREKARKNKDWDKADELRGKIEELGFEMEDSKKGFMIKKK
jgi:cysteinyl-tRNA synthetase